MAFDWKLDIVNFTLPRAGLSCLPIGRVALRFGGRRPGLRISLTFLRLVLHLAGSVPPLMRGWPLWCPYCVLVIQHGLSAWPEPKASQAWALLSYSQLVLLCLTL